MTTSSHRRLANAVFLNGLIYYFYLFVMSAINVVLIYLYAYDNLLSTFERVMYSILTCRVILDIRTETKEGLEMSSPNYSVRLPNRSK